jgi:preprotein translocase subunit SecA
LQEATIVAQAGRKGAVMISTNMAGRGTDILLGGNAEYLAKSEVGEAPVAAAFTDGAEYEKAAAEYKKRFAAALEKFKAQCKSEHDEVVAAGGLHIIGTERHESRRIDNQLRGRAGRQGDPGSSRFYLSLDDYLIRVFGGDRMKNLMTRFGMKPGEVIEHPWVTRSIENAQKRVEAHNFDIRKNLLEYDDVMNQQRKAIYALRREVLGGTDAEIREKMLDLIEGGIIAAVETHCPQRAPVEKWDIPAMAKDLEQVFATPFDFIGVDISREALENRAYETVEKFFLAREKQTGEEVLRRVERRVYLELIDTHWKDHLLQMDHLKEGIHLRGYGQKDPKQEYKKEGYNMFVEMMARMQNAVLETIFHVTITQETPEEYERRQEAMRAKQKMVEQHQQIAGGAAASLAAAPTPEQLAQMQKRQGGGGPARGQVQAQQAAPPPPAKIETYRRERPKVGRNEPCYCGSGKKYKNCHLQEDEQAERAAH